MNTHVGISVIIDESVIISNWPAGQPLPGHYSYPFMIKLPEWLPSSIKLVHESSSF